MPGSRDVAAVRRFNRFYTRVVGALDEGHLHSDFSLAEVRLLFELAHRDRPTATQLVRDLGLDAGYVSRLLRSLGRRRLVSRAKSADDARETHLTLTKTGRTAVVDLEARASADVANLLAPLPRDAQKRVVAAMDEIQSLLYPASSASSFAPTFFIRQHGPGDMGWVVQAHGQLYFREYGWDERFESLVARVVAGFIDSFDAKHERCWIAERDGTNVGCIFVMKHPQREGVAQLRLFLIDPSARGQGLGHRLVAECVSFARSAGYHTITLWTQDVLAAARHIYKRAGFELTTEEKHNSFGVDLNAEVWELANLSPRA
ncbi:MAG: helix-turn-helix domain-containing GNAT family N-acetyltransferase [Gemmatimonadaceae bacterium]